MQTLLKVLIPAWFAVVPCLGTEPPPDWGRLVEVAKLHGLPLPPTGARLALIHSMSWMTVGDRSHPHDPACYEPGWVIKEHADGSVDALRGTAFVRLAQREAREPAWREFVAKRIPPELGGFVAEFERGDCLLAALQCAASGDPQHAGVLWQLYESAKPIRGSGLTKEERQLVSAQTVIPVRDFAAMQIAIILQLAPLDPPDSTWTPARWKALHAKVRERLKTEGIVPMAEDRT